MHTITLGFSGLAVAVDVPSVADLQWLREFFCPWFEERDVDPHIGVTYRVDRAVFEDYHARGASGESVDAFMMDTRIIEQPRWRSPDDSTVLLDADREMFFRIGGGAIEIVSAHADPRSRVNVMRVIRELAMDAAHGAGGRFLHASCVALDGRAIAITGPRNAGKTSLLVYLLGAGCFDYLTNDRLLVSRRGDACLFTGMPTIVSIRSGTLGMFPGLARDISERRYSTRFTLGESANAAADLTLGRNANKWGVSPAQFCAVMGVTPVAAAQPGIVLIPRQTGRADGFALRELDAEQSLAALAQGMFGFIGPGHRSQVYRAPGERAASPSDEQFLSLLRDSCRVYECSLGTDAYDSAACAEAIRQLP